MTIQTLPQSVNLQITLIYQDESLTLEQKWLQIAEIVKLYEGFATQMRGGEDERRAEFARKPAEAEQRQGAANNLPQLD